MKIYDEARRVLAEEQCELDAKLEPLLIGLDRIELRRLAELCLKRSDAPRTREKPSE